MLSMAEHQMTLSGLPSALWPMLGACHQLPCFLTNAPQQMHAPSGRNCDVTGGTETLCRANAACAAGLGRKRRARQMETWWWRGLWEAWSMGGHWPLAGQARWASTGREQSA